MLQKKVVFSKGLFLVLVVILSSSPLVLARDKDNNPPGPAGGRGTNWENPPGPKGGVGSSPNRHWWQWPFRHRGNPPGPKGGPGYGPRWESWFEKHPNLKDKVDTDNDGVISLAESIAAHRFWPHLNPPASEE